MVKKLLTKTNFPIKRFASGAVLAAALIYAQFAMQIANNNSDVPVLYQFLYLLLPFIFALAFGFIPMFIAFRKDKQHKQIIAWLAFCAMWVPLGILLFLGSLIWTLCDKPANAA